MNDEQQLREVVEPQAEATEEEGPAGPTGVSGPPGEPEVDEVEAAWRALSVDDRIDRLAAVLARGPARPAEKVTILPEGVNFEVEHLESDDAPVMLLTFTDPLRNEKYVVRFFGRDGIKRLGELVLQKPATVDVFDASALKRVDAQRTRDKGAAARGRRRR